MTKKDYELIAGVIRDRLNNSTHLDKLDWSDNEIQIAKDVITDTAYFMCNRLAKDNPKFDRDRFMAACGVTK